MQTETTQLEQAMKCLSHYIEENQSNSFKKHGAFFAFSKRQYEDQAKPDIKYMSCGAGLICPEANATALMDDLESIVSEGIKQDIAENGVDNIIKRELANHEYGYTWDITDTCSALERYGIEKTYIQTMANQMDWSDY